MKGVMDPCKQEEGKGCGWHCDGEASHLLKFVVSFTRHKK